MILVDMLFALHAGNPSVSALCWHRTDNNTNQVRYLKYFYRGQMVTFEIINVLSSHEVKLPKLVICF